MTKMCRRATIGAVLLTLVLATTADWAQAPELLLFGGGNHKTFMGCLNCGRFDAGSVCNRFGDHGSRFSSESIWNRFGDYGSRYSSYSPWNKYASDPPVIVDRDGNFYGYFTSNRYHPKRTKVKFFLVFLDNIHSGDTILNY